MGKTTIEWTATQQADGTWIPGYTFNPWHGCIEVSPGCTGCYARVLNHRYGFNNWGPAKTTERRGMSENYWCQPLRWQATAVKTGQRARVFCASMADVFEDHPQVAEWRMRLFNLIDSTPMLDWLLLTKRPENVMPMMADWLEGTEFPSNIWLGTSVEDQRRADERIPHLLRVPARVRFLSCEPLLGAVDISRLLVATPCWHCGNLDGEAGRCYCGVHIPPEIHWCIVGGESGHGARPMHPDWARALRDQCQAAGVAFFFKQWGEWLPVATPRPDKENAVLSSDGSLKRPATWEDVMATCGDDWGFARIGKHAAGRLLDGAEWNQFPDEVSA